MIRSYLTVLLISQALGNPSPPADSAIAIVDDYGKCYGGYYPDPVWAAKSAITWDPATERVPLLPTEAKAIACDKLRDYLKDWGAIDVEDGGLRLVKVDEAWTYTVVVRWWQRGIGMRGTPLWACVHVRMDKAAVVEPSLLVTPPPNGLLTASDKTRGKRIMELLRQHSGYDYRACGNLENEALEPVARLESFHARDLQISGQTLEGAINSLLKACGNGKDGKKIASVLRAAALDHSRRITLEAKEISFIGAVDAFCVQAGAKWVIDLSNPERIRPVLILLPDESSANLWHPIPFKVKSPTNEEKPPPPPTDPLTEKEDKQPATSSQ